MAGLKGVEEGLGPPEEDEDDTEGGASPLLGACNGVEEPLGSEGIAYLHTRHNHTLQSNHEFSKNIFVAAVARLDFFQFEKTQSKLRF